MFDKIVLQAARDFAVAYDKKNWPEHGLNSVLYGPEGLTSLELVAFLSLVEEYVENDTQQILIIASEHSFSSRKSPFQTLQTLTEYLKTMNPGD